MMAKEFIRVLGFNLKRGERRLRKVLQVLRHDDITAAHDSGSEHMPVSEIGKRECRD